MLLHPILSSPWEAVGSSSPHQTKTSCSWACSISTGLWKVAGTGKAGTWGLEQLEKDPALGKLPGLAAQDGRFKKEPGSGHVPTCASTSGLEPGHLKIHAYKCMCPGTGWDIPSYAIPWRTHQRAGHRQPPWNTSGWDVPEDTMRPHKTHDNCNRLILSLGQGNTSA